MTREVAERVAQEALAGAGLSAHLVPGHGVRRALERRMKGLGVTSAAEYEARYRESAGEREAYLEGLLIGETSFFRDGAVFDEMLRWCLQWLAGNAGTLRILCAPCSSGEEPYSIAAMLLGAGVGRFSIDAVDLSGVALAQARAAEYQGMALRNIAEPGVCWFLERCGTGWKVVEKVRRYVRFRQANMMDADPLAGAKYELICSRNLMIYQTAEARAHTAAVLAEGLEAGGRVVLGSADWCRELGERFALEQPMQSFALRLRAAVLAEEVREVPSEPVLEEEVVEERATEVGELYRRALEAYLGGEERRAEWLCRQALYVDAEHGPALDLMSKLARPHVPARHRLALQARLERHGRTGDRA